MALLESLEINNTGQFEEYWKNFHIQINAAHKTVLVEAIGYKDEAARTAGKDSSGHRERAEISGEDYDTWYNFLIPEGATCLGDVLGPASYKLMKEHNEKFTNAVDLI